MADPTRYEQDYDFSDFAAHNPSTPLPGDRLDIELANLQRTTGETIDALKDIRRSDGKLANKIVTRDSLSSDLLKLTGADRGVWATATSYVVGDLALSGGRQYQCLIAHLSGDFATDLAASRWSLTAAESAEDAAASAAAAAAAAGSVHSVPAGGSTGQVLAKASGADYDAEWIDAAAGIVPVGGDGIADDAPAVTAALAAGAAQRKKVIFKPGATYRLGSTIYCDGYVDVEATDAKFVIDHTGAGFNFDAGYAESVALTSNYTIGSTALAVSAMASALNIAEPFKIVSEAVDGADRDQGSDVQQYRNGEWLVAGAGSTITAIVLAKPARFPRGISPTSTVGEEAEIDAYTTSMNAIIIRPHADRLLNWRGGEVYFDSSIDLTGSGGAKNPIFTIGGRIRPVVERLSVHHGGGQGISVSGCYCAKIIDCDVADLTDDTTNGHYGYGVADASYGTEVIRLTGRNCRHCYTSAVSSATTAQLASRGLQLGRTVGARIVDAKVSGNANGSSPLDTHSSSEDVQFIDCLVDGSLGWAIGGRGRNIHVINPVVRNSAYGIYMATEYASGQADDDGWMSQKDRDHFTSGRVVNADIECKTDPFIFASGTFTVDGATVKSAGHRLVDCQGADVRLIGNIEHRVTTLVGAMAIQEQTGEGWLEVSAAPPSQITGAVPVGRITIMEDCKLYGDASLATDALDDLKTFDAVASTIITIRGRVEYLLGPDHAAVVGSFRPSSLKSGSGTLNGNGRVVYAKSSAPTTRYEYSVDGADRLIASNNNVNVSHTGSTSANNNVYTPPGQPFAIFDEAGHYHRLELTGRKVGTAGTVALTIRTGDSASFNFTVTSAATDISWKLVVESFPRGTTTQLFRLTAFFASGSTPGASDVTTIHSYTDRTFTISTLLQRLAVTLGNAGDTLTIDTMRQYSDVGLAA